MKKQRDSTNPLDAEQPFNNDIVEDTLMRFEFETNLETKTLVYPTFCKLPFHVL